MFPKTAVLATLIFLVGCEKSPPHRPVVSTDTQSDLSHDHQHVHGDQNWHDHTHQNGFEGAHVHPHVHGHRHAPLPHGGTALSLQLLSRQSGVATVEAEQDPDSKRSRDSLPDSPHLEMVLDSQKSLSIFCLSESPDGTWEAWDAGTEVLILAFQIDHSDWLLEFELGEDSKAFTVLLPVEIQQTMEPENSVITLKGIELVAGDHVLRSRESLQIRDGELDAVLE